MVVMVRLSFPGWLALPIPHHCCQPTHSFFPNDKRGLMLLFRLQSVAVKFHLVIYSTRLIFFCCVADRQHYLLEPAVPSPRTQEHLQNRPLGFGGRYTLSLILKDQSEINLINSLIFKVILDTLKGLM